MEQTPPVQLVPGKEVGAKKKRSSPGTSSDDYDHYVGLRTKRQLETLIGLGASVIGFVWDLIKWRDVQNIKSGMLRLQQQMKANIDRTNMLMQTTLQQGKLLVEHD